MRKLIGFFSVVIILAVVGFMFRDTFVAQVGHVVAYSPCTEPKTYTVGKIDSQFGLTSSEFKASIEEAANVWKAMYGRELFIYDPQSAFKINLVYDNRQTLNTEINQKNADLRAKDSELRPKIDAYNQKSVALQTRIKKLNEEIESWNAKGGAPDDVYERLRTEQAALRQEMSALNAEADSLSLTTDELKDEAETLETTVTTFNDALHDRPEGGKYTLDDNGERIDIAIFDNHTQLVNVLAHELGHSLGMDHVNNDKAIMYSKTNDAITPTNQDFQELTRVCTKRNLIVDRWNYFRENFFTRLGSFVSVESTP